MEKDIEYILDAHKNYAKKPSKAVRKWDGKTPYYIHPLWCATTIASETALDEETKRVGIQALLYHDILEDTTKELPEGLDEKVKQAVKDMTFEGGSKQEMEEVWTKPKAVRLYKLYDKVSNLLDGIWMDDEKWDKYVEYTMKLYEDVECNYGELNITRIARTVAEMPREYKEDYGICKECKEKRKEIVKNCEEYESASCRDGAGAGYVMDGCKEADPILREELKDIQAEQKELGKKKCPCYKEKD
jgi:hypothetical protein